MVKKLKRGKLRQNLLVWSKNSKTAVEIQRNAAAQFPETGLKQVFPRTGSWRERPKTLIKLVAVQGSNLWPADEELAAQSESA
jgi:hypothetical protein